MQPKLTIQERLKDLRVERSLTLEQLSAETGIGGAGKVLRCVHRLPAGADRTKKSPKHRAKRSAFG